MSYQIGLDGGGTKTECILIDPAGRVVSTHTGAGCNPSLFGPERAAATATSLLELLRTRAAAHFEEKHGHVADPSSLIAATLLCMAGARGFWQEFAVALRGFGRVATTDDSHPVLELATGGAPGLALHSGTGSFVAARAPDGSIHYAGGLGWRFGDPGSGYDLGQRGIARGLLELQGWAAPSQLGPAVRDHSGLGASVTASDVTRYFYQLPEPNRALAAFAPTVLRLAAEHDEAAAALVTASVSGLLDFAVGVATKLFPATSLGNLKVGLSGAILTHPVAQQALASRTPFPLIPVTDAPIEGVRRLLARL